MRVVQRMTSSFQARVIYPYTQKYFSKTRYGKRISFYKDKFKNRRCFFIGNGPSLQAKDLDILQEHGEITFAFNRIYNIFNQTIWRPTFYISQDEKMLSGCKNIVDNLDLPVKFIPIQLMWYYDIQIHDATYFNMKNQRENNLKDNLLWSNNAASSIYCASTGMYTAAQLATYMGFASIYLIGVDHHFHISQNDKGEIVIDDKVKDYFSDNYNQDRDNLYIPNTENSTYTYIAMKKYCNGMNINIYNATRGGRLEVFPRVEFDSLFDN